MEKMIIKVKKHSDNIINLLGFEGEAIVVANNGAIVSNFQVDSPGLLIGRGGEGIEALQHILRLLLGKELMTEQINILADVAGYRVKRNDELARNVRDKANTVLSTGITETLSPMSSYERRIVHMTCSSIADIETESEGDGSERRVVIKTKKDSK